MLSHSVRLALTMCSLAALSACGDDAPPVTGDISDASTLPDAQVQEPVACTTGQSQACTCAPVGSGSVGVGTQTCSGGTWLPCACSMAPPGGSPGQCLPGRYSGSFKGTYRSGFALGFGIPVEALDLVGGTTGLSFTLNESVENTGGEFPIYTVSNGYVKGTANGLFPFEGVLTGQLDCATKQFVGELDGCYAVIIDLFGFTSGRYKGPVVGTYDADSHTFVMGTWDVLEMGTGLFGEPGGEGDWNAAWKGEATGNEPPPGAPACAVGDAGVPAEAGTP